ncbi:M50 family metallopeptidase [Nocardioides sp. SR21]|uniref:M50 family metallopeptidase n=1 Tax=Nocardioides sp. SR21 TaxID=2919501 RepID=UPI001FAAAF07|nr:M50 family metallopeptidase [Nocardioides sp. SR21]
MTAADVLSSIWDDVTGSQPAPAQLEVLLTAVAAALVVVLPWTWRIGRHVVTIAHEGAHGVAALLSGRRLSGIRLHSDTSGVTVSRGRPTGPGMVATAFAGYVGPALLGLGAAYLLHRQHALAVLWLVVLLLALLLVQIRNFYGLYAVGIAGAAVFAVSWWGSETVQSLAAYAGTWFLLIAAPRPVLELQTLRRAGGARTSDADQLARLTRVPGLVWVGIFLLVTCGCLFVGGRWLWAAA